MLSLTQSRRPSTASVEELLAGRLIDYGDPVELQGVVEGPLQFAPDRLYLALSVENIRLKGRDINATGTVGVVALVNPQSPDEYGYLRLRYRTRLRLKTKLAGVDSFRNPGVSSFSEYLARKGYDATAFVKSPLLIERLGDSSSFRPLLWLYHYRQQIERQIIKNFSPETSGVLNAALLGNRFYLERPVAARFRDAGTYHVLVISGLHISFIGGLVFLATRRAIRTPVVRFIISASVLWAYVLAVGAEASVVRAALMFTIVALGPVLHRSSSSLNALGAAALLLLIWRPANVFDPSFQLTFLSVIAILVLAWPILRMLSEIGAWRPTRSNPHPPSCALWLQTICECLFWSERRWKTELSRANYSYRLFKAPLACWLDRFRIQPVLRYCFGAVVVSLTVQVTILPLLILYFHRVSLASLLLNIGVSALMAVVSLVAIIGLLVLQFSASLATPLISLANLLNWLMVHSVDPFAAMGVASIRVPEYSGWGRLLYLLYYLPLLYLARELLIRNNHQMVRRQQIVFGFKSLISAQLIFLVCLVIPPLHFFGSDGKLHVDFLDVGQGDAALVTIPDGTTILVDGGGRRSFSHRITQDAKPFQRDTLSIGEAVVSEYLWWRGLDRVDYVLATHADADHIDGLADVARDFQVRAALLARVPATDPELQKFADALRSKSVPIRLVGAGDVLRIGRVHADVLWPTPNGSPTAPSSNDDSVVLRIVIGTTRILLTGDIERRAEQALVAREEDLRTDVVKVPHHGSKTSSTPRFVEATHAKYAIISVGQKSIFGHPSPQVVERWRGGGAEVLTTSESGTISVSTDGRSVELKVFVP